MNLKHIYIPLALSLAACSADKDPLPEPITEDNPVYMSFSVSVEGSDNTRATRADDLIPDGSMDWSTLDKEDGGNEFECKLLGDDFFPVIVLQDPDDATGETYKSVGDFKILSYWKSTDEETKVTTFTLHGSFKPVDEYNTEEALQKLGDTAQLMVFANTVSNGGKSPLDAANNLENIVNFDFTAKSGSTSWTDEPSHGFEAIPMWGISKVDFTNAKQGQYTEINNGNACALLRAMAKVRVNLALLSPYKENNKVKLLSASLNRINESGYLLPEGWNTCTNTSTLKLDKTFREKASRPATAIPTDPDDNDSPTVDFITYKVRNTGLDKATPQYEINGDYIEFYIPEIANDNSDALQITIEYEVDDFKRSNHLYFTKYENGGPKKDPATGNYQRGLWNVVRNHIYEFNITGVQASKISVEARVKDWQYHKEVQPLE